MKNLVNVCRFGVRFRSSFISINESSIVHEIENGVKAYSEIPGPKQLPIVGNSWRFAPFIGKIFFFWGYNDQN